MIEVRAVREDEWRDLRETRLAALKDTPQAFWSTYERDEALPEEAWRERAAAGSTFLARDGTGRPVGMATGIAHPAHPATSRELVGMWVAPVARGHGVAAQLIEAVVDWARADGASELGLWFVDGNETARRVYERAGFALTGDHQDFPGDDPRTESRMVRLL